MVIVPSGSLILYNILTSPPAIGGVSMNGIKVLVLVLILAVLTTPALAGPYIEVSPNSQNFGEVEVGTAATAIITVTNIGDHPLVIDDIGFQAGSSADFSITIPTLPMVIGPVNGMIYWMEVEVAFTPSAAGYSAAVLEIYSNDPMNPVVSVNLGGVGVGPQQQPVTIEDVLAFFDASVEAGRLTGTGKMPVTFEPHLNNFKRMLLLVGKHIDEGNVAAACNLLEWAYVRSDGQMMPPDFVQGDAVVELSGMILQLRADLGCV